MSIKEEHVSHMVVVTTIDKDPITAFCHNYRAIVYAPRNVDRGIMVNRILSVYGVDLEKEKVLEFTVSTDFPELVFYPNSLVEVVNGWSTLAPEVEAAIDEKAEELWGAELDPDIREVYPDEQGSEDDRLMDWDPGDKSEV